MTRMKSRKEIEELLGKELQYVQHEVRSNSDWGNFGIDVLDTYWELTEDDIKKVKEKRIHRTVKTHLAAERIVG